MKKRINPKSIALLISYITIAVNILFSIWHTPYLLKYLGDTNVGVRNFALTIANYLALFSFGMGGAYLRFLALEKKKRGSEAEKKTNALFLLLLLVAGTLVFVCGTTLSILIRNNTVSVNTEYAGQEGLISSILFICTISTSIAIPGAIFPLILDSKEEFLWKNLVTLIAAVLSPIISVLVLVIYGNKGTSIDSLTIYVSVAALLVDLIVIFVNGLFCFAKLKTKFSFKFKKDDFKQVLDIVKFSFYVFLITTIISINGSSDKIILGSLVSYSAVTIYSLSQLFDSYLRIAENSVGNICAPAYSRLAVENNSAEINRIFKISTEATILICATIIGGYISCGENFIMSWLGKERISVFYYSLPLLISNFILIGSTLSFPIHRAYGKLKTPAFIYLITFVFNIGISVGLVFVIGIWGCIIGTVFSYISETIFISIFNKRKLDIEQKSYWKNILIYSLISFIPAGLIYAIFKIWPLDISSWVLTIIKGTIYLVIYIPILFVFKLKFIKTAKSVVLKERVYQSKQEQNGTK